MTNIEKFEEELVKQYTYLFKNDSGYDFVKNGMTSAKLANRMIHALLNKTGNKEGTGVRNTCKVLKIKHTYEAIYCFLSGGL